jgi:hypothetical protein
MQENMKYGRYCKSGMSVITEADNKMMCVELGTVKTNIDSYAAARDSPYECKIHDGEGNAVSDFETACQYYYTASDGS